MKTRLISIACMLPLLAFIIIGSWPLLVILFAISGFALYEYFRGFEKLELKCSLPVAGALWLSLAGILFASLCYAKSWELYEILVDLWVFAVIGVCMLLIIFDKGHNILAPTYTMIGVLYIVFTFSHVFLIERFNHAYAWLPFIIAYMADTGGFFGGMYFGRHKLAPNLSPKKTVEGAIGGVLAAVLGALIFALIADRSHIVLNLLMGLFGGMISELGDLTASAFKRKMGIKDYSNLIPGHGGVLDRIDSVIFTAPFVYYVIRLFL